MIKTKSLFRRLEYKALSNLKISGKILDIGGSKVAGYHELIKGDHTFTVGNINPEYNIDIVFNAEERFPFENNEFDGVLLVNIIEHLFDYQSAINESYRVLKSGGIMAGVVPFMLNVHESPSDYFRYTKFALENIFKKAGFKNILVKEIGTGAFSVSYHLFIGFIRWNWLASLIIPIFQFGDYVISLIKKESKMSVKYMPLGYYFEVEK